jgi:hypothetical protein
MQKAPDYDRIQHMLRATEERFSSHDEVWIQNYLDLGDKALGSQQSALGTQRSAKALGA